MHATGATPSFQPLWRQIRALIVHDIEAGAWKPGEAIPSELELAARFGVAQGTVRRAIDALADENLVVRRQGKGTYVATHTEEKVSLPRFLRIRRDDGVDEYPGSRLIDVRRGKAGIEAARLLDLKPGESVLLVRRLLEFGGAPVVLDEITLPAALFRGLTRARLDAYHGSMYGFFETEFGVRMLKAREKLKAIVADADSAALLGVAPGTPLLAVERVTTTFGERPVEWRRGLCTTMRHHYLNELG
ncbi:MAG TPA: GntR family transcriptional regulator [Casimicrobiaceae bacterium]|jgi:GntR family transcriptional regulator|nr:GntR family transcriptional regulator [Casimicrobiaceae bacterium]